MYNNQQLPFPTNQFITQPMRIDVTRPPIVFQIRCAPWLEQYVPWITGIFMDMTTNNAQGPITIHFYNRMAQNNWNNQDFAAEIANVADFIYLQLGQNQNPQAIPPVIDAYYGLRSKFEVALAEGLRQFIAPQDQYIFDQAIQSFQVEIQRIMAIRNGQPAQQAPQRMPPMQAQYVPPVQQAAYGSTAPQPMQGYQVPGMAPQRASGGGGRDYGSPTQAQPVPMTPPPQAAAPTRQAVPTGPQQGPTVGAAPTQAAPRQELIDPDTMAWNPSPEAPHPMLYNPVKIKMMYTLDANRRTKPQPTSTDMDMINYERHLFPTMFGRVPANMEVVKDNTELATEIKQGALDALEESNTVDQEGGRLEESLGLRNILSAFTLDDAIMDLRCAMEAKIDRENRPMVYQAYAQVFTAIMGETTEYDLIHKLKDSSSYLELREKLNAASATASPALITDISLKLTRLMNDILRNRLTILASEIEVEDFANDLEILLATLKNNYGENGERMYKAFIKDQAVRIRAMFEAPDLSTEGGRQLHESLLDARLTSDWDGRDDKPTFTFFGPTVRVTFLNVISHDLILQGMPGLGNVITKQHSAILYDLAVSLFNVKPVPGPVVDRQYVVTKDGRVMEITKGELIEGTYLMNLVK